MKVNMTHSLSRQSLFSKRLETYFKAGEDELRDQKHVEYIWPGFGYNIIWCQVIPTCPRCILQHTIGV